MTDVMAALALLADGDHPARTEVLSDFEQRWRGEPLVMDKWFSVQAIANRAGVLDDIRRLMQHPAFSLHNPNKVRALVGAFAAGNPALSCRRRQRLCVPRGMVSTDAGPQIAARLLRAIARWRRYDDGRQAAMRAVLERVLAAKVSKDAYEIASKSLDAT